MISYQVDDDQYVATMITGNRGIELPGTVLVFKLGGAHQLDVQQREQIDIPEQPEVEVTSESYSEGDTLYHAHCANCHRGIGVTSVVATAAAPDLRSMNKETHAEYSSIVLGGARSETGMPGFADALDELEIEAIRGFLVIQANQLRDWQASRKIIEETRKAREEAASQIRG